MSKGTLTKDFIHQSVEKNLNGCWEWTRNKLSSSTGYPVCSIDGNAMSMYRESYRLFNGEIPVGMCVCHSCDNRACVNPSHLFLGTRGDNNKDRANKGRSNVGESRPLSKLTESQVIDIFNSPLAIRELARNYSVNRNTIKNIKLKLSWGYLWK